MYHLINFTLSLRSDVTLMTHEKLLKIRNKLQKNSFFYTIYDNFLLSISRRDLVNQESRYNVQLEAAEQKALAAQQKVNELKTQINDLERDISNKSGVHERKYIANEVPK